MPFILHCELAVTGPGLMSTRLEEVSFVSFTNPWAAFLAVQSATVAKELSLIHI